MGKFNKKNLFAPIRLSPRPKSRPIQIQQGVDGEKELVGVITYVFSGVNRDYCDRPPYPPEEAKRRQELYSKLTNTPSSNKTNQKIKRSDKLSLKERWEAAKKEMENGN